MENAVLGSSILGEDDSMVLRKNKQVDDLRILYEEGGEGGLKMKMDIVGEI